jgi:hypothetical protein
MDADEIIAFADAVRCYALEAGRDINNANLFVHEVLVRALKAERVVEARAMELADAA